MTDALKNATVDNSSLDGLDGLLEIHNMPESVLSQVHADDWTVDEAAEYLNVSTKTIRRHLASGKIQGYKVSGANGPEWRISHDSLDNHRQQTKDETVEKSTVQSSVESTWDTGLVNFLQADIERLRKENEALIYRTGYLQAQVEQRDVTIKLLECKQQSSSFVDRLILFFRR